MKQPATTPQASIPATAEVFFDDATKEKIHKHLSDINDVITEEDIKNVKTDMSILPLSLQQQESNKH